MQLSWQGTVAFVAVVAGCVVAAVLGQDSIAQVLGGLAGGLLVRFGAVGLGGSK